MITVFWHWVINTVAIIITALVLPGVRISNLLTAVWVALTLGIINALLKPLLLFLTLPLNILTLGLFTLVINALLIELVAVMVPGFMVVNFWWALLFSLVLSVVNSFLHKSLT